METPKDISLQGYVAIGGIAIGIALWLVKSGPLHILMWIIGLGALLLATQKAGKVLG